ncbi:MAG: hypothetical protein Kow0098_13760 [Ignavibacteriaceae bacterium]
MIVYSITAIIRSDIESQWTEWMKTRHIPDVIKTGYFVGFKFYKIITPQSSSGNATYEINYFCESSEKLNDYLEKEAERLRKEHNDKFGSGISVARSVLEEI